MSFFASLLVSAALNTSVNTVTSVTFCYENRELLPHYAKLASSNENIKPGAAIEILQQLDNDTPAISFDYVRMPWKRCLNKIKQGNVDAIIGRYTEARREIGVFPLKNDQPDATRSFSVATGCLIHNNRFDIEWDGKSINLPDTITMALPRAYSTIDRYENIGFEVYTVDSLVKAQELLFNQKVDATIAHCGRKALPPHITLNPVPINSSYGYLIFSKQFYAKEDQLVKNIWSNLSRIDKQQFYDKYR